MGPAPSQLALALALAWFSRIYGSDTCIIGIGTGVGGWQSIASRHRAALGPELDTDFFHYPTRMDRIAKALGTGSSKLAFGWDWDDAIDAWMDAWDALPPNGRSHFALLLTLSLSFFFLPILGRNPAFIMGGELRLLS
jgi:hypothetical protein